MKTENQKSNRADSGNYSDEDYNKLTPEQKYLYDKAIYDKEMNQYKNGIYDYTMKINKWQKIQFIFLCLLIITLLVKLLVLK